MIFSVQYFLKLRLVEKAILRTERQLIENKLIESISVIELPVENFVRQNELVLTTCMGCNDDLAIFKNFVKDVQQSGASALVVSSGRHVQQIPREIIVYANALGFSLIEIPWEIRFADIIETVLREINNIKQSELKRFESLQKKLLMYYLDGRTLSDAAKLIQRELGKQIVIMSIWGNIKGKSEGMGDLSGLLTASVQMLEAGKPLDMIAVAELEEFCRVYEISSKNTVYGYLYIKKPSHPTNKDCASENKTLVARHIVSSLELWFDREQTIFETEMHHKDSFVWRLIKADKHELDELAVQAKSIGYQLAIPYLCMVGRLNYLEESYKVQRSGFTSYEQWKFHCIKYVKKELIRIGKSLNRKLMLTYQNELLIVFLELQEGQVNQAANSFLDIVEHRIKQSYAKLEISWGISESIVRSYTFHTCFMDAKISLEACQNEKKPGYRNIHHNPGIYRLLSLLYEHREAQEITLHTIGKLVEYDEENKLDLINTFKAYIKNERNVSRTARALHLHRQSLLYRLKRIEEIAGLSLDHMDDIFLLEVCVRLWEKHNSTII